MLTKTYTLDSKPGFENPAIISWTINANGPTSPLGIQVGEHSTALSRAEAILLYRLLGDYTSDSNATKEAQAAKTA